MRSVLKGILPLERLRYTDAKAIQESFPFMTSSALLISLRAVFACWPNDQPGT
ncbi:hypothetical protein BD408DRAFT_409449 [Parasitella parasitica]|nr:hypothetical protein BD408DRAFT_409449 [Parasitella parasitica]